MKALYYTGNKTMELRETPAPVPSAGECLVRIKACGICGSDFEGYLGKTGRRTAPMVMGHEAAGVVVVPAGSGAVPAGTKVAVFPNFYCGECEQCKAGMTNNCANGSFMGVMAKDGCMAEYVAVPESVAIPFPDETPFEAAAMAEPLAVALSAVKKAPPEMIRESGDIIIIGGGTIGLLVLSLLRRMAKGCITVSDVYSSRLERALKLGADAVINPSGEDFAGAVKRITGGAMYPLAFEAAGFAASARASLDALKPGGTVVWIGNAQKTIDVDMQKIVVTELKITGSHIYSPDEFRESLKLIACGKVDASQLITDRRPLEDGAAAFASLEGNKDGGMLKIMLTTD